MSQEKYVIVDIHPVDAYYDMRNFLIGKIVSLSDRFDNEYKSEGISNEYGQGYLTLEEELKTDTDEYKVGDELCVFAFMLAPLSEVENK